MKEKEICLHIDDLRINGRFQVEDEDFQLLKEVDLKDIDLILVIPSSGISIKFKILAHSD